MKSKILFISHTHHDREWYLPFEGFRYILVRNIDKLLNIFEKDPRFRFFLLDGQTVVIEDYLEIRPYMEHLIRKHVCSGRLAIGPLYVQPDEFLVSGESLVRNLLIGHRVACKYGGVAKLGYLPDTFGHTAQLPQILRGFNIDNFIFHRGFGESLKEYGCEFIWRAPDGSEVIAIYLPKSYCNANRFPDDLEKALKWIEESVKHLLKYSKAGVILAMNGCDHRPPQENIPDIIEKLREAVGDEFEIIHGGLFDYIRLLNSIRDRLKVFTGEMIWGRYHPILTGVWSSRTYLLMENWRTEAILTYYAEPLATIAWIMGMKYPQDQLTYAWKTLLKNHPHDSICGCSTDEVHRECMTRFAKVQHVCNMIIRDSMEHLVGGLAFSSGDELGIVVFNPTPYERTDVAEVMLPFDADEVTIVDEEGNVVPHQLVDDDIPSYSIVHPVKLVGKGRIIFMAEKVPPMGFRIYRIRSGASNVEFESDVKATGEDSIGNKYFRVKASEKGGTLTVEDLRSGRVFREICILEDMADAGDEYDYSPPDKDKVYYSRAYKASIKVIEKGPVRACLRIDLDFKLPKSLTSDRSTRSDELVSNPVSIYVFLYRGIPRIDIAIKVDNRSRDHRLRVLFPTDVSSDVSYADTHFYVIKRPLELPKGDDWRQPPLPTKPQRMWVDVNDGEKGFMLANRGLPEYEVFKDENGRCIIALTLFRAVGWLSRPDLKTRRGNAGPQIATPDAQCLGEHVFYCSIIPHEKNWLKSRAYLVAREFNIPLMTAPIKLSGEVKVKNWSMSLTPKTLPLSAFKKAEDDDTLVVRFYDVSGGSYTAKLSFPVRVRAAWETNLNEERLKDLKPKEKEVEVEIDPYKIKTISILLEGLLG